MKEYIQNTLIEMHSTCSVDKYGQVSKFNFNLNSLFKSRAGEVVDFVNNDKSTITIGTYGSSFGTYKALTIVCEDTKRKCGEALSKNPNYMKNMCSW